MNSEIDFWENRSVMRLWYFPELWLQLSSWDLQESLPVNKGD